MPTQVRYFLIIYLVNEIYGSVHTKLEECVNALKGVLGVREICFLSQIIDC